MLFMVNRTTENRAVRKVKTELRIQVGFQVVQLLAVLEHHNQVFRLLLTCVELEAVWLSPECVSHML